MEYYGYYASAGHYECRICIPATNNGTVSLAAQQMLNCKSIFKQLLPL